jgi:hypothetical protein
MPSQKESRAGGRGRLRADAVVLFTWMQSLSLSLLRSSRKRGGRLGPGLAATQCHSTARRPQLTRRRPLPAPATRNRAPKLSTHPTTTSPCLSNRSPAYVQPLGVLSVGNGGQQANDWDADAPPPDRARSLRLHGYATLLPRFLAALRAFLRLQGVHAGLSNIR